MLLWGERSPLPAWCGALGLPDPQTQAEILWGGDRAVAGRVARGSQLQVLLP